MSDTSISTARTTAVTLKDGNAGADDTLTVTAAGSLKTTATAIALDTTNAPAGAGIVINNSGTISATAKRVIDVTSTTGGIGTKITLNNDAGGVISSSGGTNDKADIFRIDPDLQQAVITVNNAGSIVSTGLSNDSQALRFGKSYSDTSITISNAATGIIKTANADAIRAGNNSTITNAGAITALSSDLPSSNLYTTKNAIDISIGQSSTIINSGTITGDESALGSDVAYNGTKSAATDTAANYTVTNRTGGVLTGNNSGAIVSSGTATITNEAGATIKGLGAATYSGGTSSFPSSKLNVDGDGIDVAGSATITNAGTIQGVRSLGFNNGGRANVSEGVDIGGGTIVNSGTIEGGNDGITVGNTANAAQTRSGSAALSLTNQAGGLIQGDTGYAIRSENKTADGSANAALTNDTIVNYGTIIGNGTIPTGTVTLSDGKTADTNTVGTLDGTAYTSAANAGSARFILGDGAAIQTGEGADTLTNYGTITGNSGRAISLEGGDDTLNLYTGGSVTGRIDGGAGNDILTLNAGSGTSAGTLANVVHVETLSVNGGAWTIADAQGYANGITIAAGASLTVAAAGSLSGAVTDNGTLSFAHSDAVTVMDAISGSGSLVQAGTGTLTLSGANTYTGGTVLSAGTLDIASAGGAGSGAIAFGSGAQTLHIEQAALTGSGGAAGFANGLTGFGAEDTIDVSGIGTATAARYDDAAHTLTLSGGSQSVTLQLDAGAAPTAGYAYGVVSDGAGGSLVAIEAVAQVIGVSASPAGGVIKAGQTVSIALATSAAVTVSGDAPVLHLGDGGTATYDAAHSTGTSLVFTYTATAGENAAALTITGVDNGASVQDAAHVALDLSGAIGQTGIGPQVDTVAPALTFASTGGLTNQATQTVSGTIGAVDAGATITLYEGGSVLGTTVAGQDGAWSTAVTFSGNGTHSIHAEASDAAGNLGSSAELTYTLDTTPPSVSFTNVGGLTNTAVQTVSGEVDSTHAGLAVSITENGAVVGTATVQSDGSWSTSVSLTGDGVHTLLASDTDQAGNVGTSNPLRFTLDTTAPTIVLAGAGGLINQAHQTIAGSVGIADAGTTITLTENGAVLGTATVGGDGRWSADVTLTGDGVHTLVASDTDAAGNTGHSADLVYTFDTTAPAVTVGSVGGLTNHASQTVSGSVGLADAGTTITLTENGSVLGTATVGGDGRWSAGITLSGDGTHTVIANDTDAAGNSGHSAALTFTLDTTAPDVTVAGSGGLTNHASQTISGGIGVADAGTLVTLTENGTVLGTATVGSDGHWSTRITLSGDGTHTVVASDTDAAGNTGRAAPMTYTLDTTAPDVDFTSYGGSVSKAVQVVHGTAGVEDAGTTVSVYESGHLMGTGIVRGDGHWSATVTLAGEGTHTLTASDTDAAGNTAVTDESLSLTLASKAPTFDVGNLVLSVYGNGDGSGDYTDNNASPIVLEQITTDGTLVSRFVLPQTTSVTNGVTNSVISGEYGSSSEGSLQLSADGHWLVIAGYGIDADTYNAGGAGVYGDVRLAQTTSIAGGAYEPVSRVIAKIGADGSVDTSTILYNVYNTNNPRSVATIDGTDFYISGQGKKGDTTQGVFLVHDGGTAATAIDTSTDTRTIAIHDGELYVSRDSKQGSGGTANVATYGGLPTSATVPSALSGIGGSVVLTEAQTNTVNGGAVGTKVYLSPENFFFANDTTLYVADSGLPKQGGVGDGGLQKWVYQGSKWVLQYTLSDGLGIVSGGASEGTTGLIGLSGRVVGDQVELYATNATLGDVDQTYVFGIRDTLAATSGAGESFTTLVTADAGTNIRGISFAPTPVVPTVAITSTGGATNHGAQTLAGTVGIAYAGTIVTILDGAKVIGTTTVKADGRWSADIVLRGSGSHSLVAQDVDAIGTVGTSAAVTYILDKTAPVAPGLEIGTPVKGSLPTPALSGTAEAGSRVSLYDGTTLLATASADATGHYSFTGLSILSPGTHVLTTRAQDAAGNLGAASTGQTVTIAAGGALSGLVQVHADRSKDAFKLGITGQSYVAEQDSYNAAGKLTAMVRSHADGSLDSTYSLDTATGTKTTDSYGATGILKTHSVVRSDGKSDVTTYAGDGTTPASEVIRYAPGGSELSDTLLFTKGVLTRETHVHADGSKDVDLSAITGRSYVAEHDGYDASGTLVAMSRSHADKSLDSTYSLDTQTGTKTAGTYDAAGILTKQTVTQADGATDTFTFAKGVLTREVQVHADLSKDVFDFAVTGKSYVADHYAYGSDGKIETLDLTVADHSHKQTAYQADQTLISTAGVADTFKGFGADTFVFASGFGKDVVNGFHAGSGTGHDVLLLDSSEATSFADLQARHAISASGHDTLITLSATDTILIKNVLPTALNADNVHIQDHGLFHV
ncbi:beta strand repeat-containing protein [Methylobacterium sp. E-045]|uniref:beta strand repeat-containing protein n=1 Tax=Methylobacterium sp. E-045 TaxID=2836575 RepID=UPI001FBA5905|nr:Ig-like domain-containing protein [Methylobacterium sp. E-045]MCJ2131308.1 Ig-like domain-containing protein [Methylobacterium sp. E-045]